MNKELELEAENFAINNHLKRYKLSGERDKECFTKGATSKYVEKQKLEFAIEQLKSLGQVNTEKAMSQRTKFRIKQLEKQLKELENGTTNS